MLNNIIRKKHGITLIALVVTVIVILILAGISISMLTGQNGILNRAQEAKEKTNKAQIEEQNDLEKTADIMWGFNTNSLASNVKVGDYISYFPDVSETKNILSEIEIYSGNTDSSKNTFETLKQETTLKWRVLDIENGKVRLISEAPTQSKITFYGSKGYNNAVYLLDKICNVLYSKTGYSKMVKNLKIEDIEKYLDYDYTQQENQNADTGKYGGIKEYSNDNKYYPNLLAKEKTNLVNENINIGLGFSEQETPMNEEYLKQEKNLKIKQTHWKKTTQEDDFSNPIYYNLFAQNMGYYWLSSRGVGLGASRAYYCIRIAGYGEITGYDLYMSNNDCSQATWSFRPVVTLNSNVLLKGGEGTSDSPYEISLRE